MPSFLLKCIPCARSGKIPISENYQEQSQTQQIYRKKSNEPVEGRVYHRAIQQTPIAVRARGYEIVEMDTMGTGGGNNDIKTAN
ncbi:unnamed protein product [Adineta steineri]|uniref:Uncharacterized protein n=1 Tax=Adineta steineri TaxID=433720 RepID=A0A814L144_9BILA|nr:unnamed protein product [Adineta steineri]CAF1057163.1 unnamed protein product [Adineta steineri]CAF3913074.1 unnamed protein product [Adineta steineri]CAF3936741.1 unnamed protein product [Adineta steineri]